MIIIEGFKLIYLNYNILMKVSKYCHQEQKDIYLYENNLLANIG